MSQYNTFSSHPLIPNSQQYIFTKKYVSIHSQDINLLKNPSSSSFEIELPDDYCNVQSCKLSSWYFPTNDYTFKQDYHNTIFVFSITDPYNPYTSENDDVLQQAIFSGLNSHILDPFVCEIEDGNYTSTTLTIELEYKMNRAVSTYLIDYLTTYFPSLLNDFLSTNCYSQFIVRINSPNRKLLIGNKSSKFLINNDSCLYNLDRLYTETNCTNNGLIPQYVQWGLPYFLGFMRVNVESRTTENSIYDSNKDIIFYYLPSYGWYDNGNTGPNTNKNYWLAPDLKNANVYFLESPNIVTTGATGNIGGQGFFYIEMAGFNSIDETVPFNVSEFTNDTNETNGIVNSAFAKIYTDNSNSNRSIIQYPYSYFNPPIERLRKLIINIRYHNGTLVDFKNGEYSFNLEFGLLLPQNKLDKEIDVPQIVRFFT
jgi:hypothetical protein